MNVSESYGISIFLWNSISWTEVAGNVAWSSKINKTISVVSAKRTVYWLEGVKQFRRADVQGKQSERSGLRLVELHNSTDAAPPRSVLYSLVHVPTRYRLCGTQHNALLQHININTVCLSVYSSLPVLYCISVLV